MIDETTAFALFGAVDLKHETVCMKRAELEQILLKHGAREELRADLIKWAAGESNSDRTQTYYSGSNSGLNTPPNVEAGRDQTMLLGHQPSTSQTLEVHPKVQDQNSMLLIPKSESSQRKVYEDLGLLGAGGMGEVRLVKDRHLQRELAMKIMNKTARSSPALLKRFEEEALVSAQLQHPNIVPVHEMGQLSDDRLYFTMREVKGVSLERAIKDWFSQSQSSNTPGDWNLHKLVDSFAQVCRAVAYAHSKGILHRDLKPSNIMLGEFGEVLVVDWGVAKFMDDIVRHDLLRSDDAMGLIEYNDVWGTQVGYVVGTPAYMSPEQASGEPSQLTERSDIYALGAILYKILSGKSPYEGASGQEVLEKVRTHAPVSVVEAASMSRPELEPMDKGGRAPRALIEICERAMDRKPERRFDSALQMANAISDWLDGSKKMEQARAVVQNANALQARKSELLGRMAHHISEAKSFLDSVPSWAGEAQKAEGWTHEEQASQLEVQIRRLDIQAEQQLHAALSHAELPDAHEALADRYLEAHKQAEACLNRLEQESQAIRLEKHATALSTDNPKKAEILAYLQGAGRLSIDATELGVRVILERFEPYRRRLVPQFFADLGTTPIVNVPLEMGSYQLRLSKSGFHDVIYPIYIERGMHWDGQDPNGVRQKIKMFPIGEWTEDECHVPAGWFWAGLHPKVNKSFSRRRCWVNDFVIQKHHVTNAEYLTFLNDLLKQGREEEALDWVPQERGGRFGERGPMIYSRDSSGLFVLGADSDGDVWEDDAPVCMVSWYSAQAYAKWWSERTCQNWIMVDEHSWSKAARGVDGRLFPWGNQFDPSYCCVRGSRKGHLKPPLKHEFELDVSVYGVRSMGGGMSDWTSSNYSEDWDEPEVPTRVIARGEHWLSGAPAKPLAVRVDGLPDFRIDRVSFRLMRWL